MPWKPKAHNAQQVEQARRQQRHQYENTAERMADKRFYASVAWRRFRAAYLMVNPLCVHCRRQGFIRVAEHVHHVKDRKAYPELTFDVDNVEGLCRPCHSAEEARRRGGVVR